MRRKRIFQSLLVLAVLFAVVIYFCNRAVVKASEGKLFTQTDDIPYNKVGLLLGTSKYLENGRINLYYLYRIEAASRLYKSGKVRYLILSGDNGREEYNEPETMKQDLMLRGVDSAHIYLDYAGFRTFDSMVRLKKIFGQDSTTVISQPFHNERALFIASKEGIAAIGFNAKDVSAQAGARVQLRESFARVKVFVDYLFGKEPKFLGEAINLP